MLEEGCALASAGGQTWAAGRATVAEMREDSFHLLLPATLRIDNHWLAVPG